MRRFSHLVPTLLILVIGSTLSIAGFMVVEQREKAQIQSDLDRAAESYTKILQDALTGAERELASVAGFFTASDDVGIDEFRTFVRPILDRNPGAWAITWLRRVGLAEREAFERAARAELFPGFEIKERNSEGVIVPATVRDEYFPIHYTEAVVASENTRAWGVDPMTDPIRRAAFMTARDTGQPNATAPIRPLSPASMGRVIVAAIQPIYKKGEIVDTVEKRRATLKGFVVGIFRIGTLVKTSLDDLPSSGMDIYLYDAGSDNKNALLYFYHSRSRSGATGPETAETLRSDLHVVRNLSMAGRPWQVIFSPAPGYFVSDGWLATSVLIAGLLLTGLLALYQHSIVSQNVRVSSLVTKQTSELKQNEDKLIALNQALSLERDKAEAANRAKSQFLTAMSHELRTPLNAVIGFSEIISSQALGPKDDGKYREYAGDIHSAGKHLLDMINDLLDLAKVEAGSEELYEEDIDIQELFDSVISLVKGRAAQNEVRLDPDIQHDLPLIHADLRKLKQILVNLATNAIKFNKKGGTVTLKAWHSKDGFVFQIIDTGIGMSDEDIPKALSRFGQIDTNLSRSQEGTGLGLPLTKALVELHGGNLDLQSRLKIGTTASVRLPSVRTVER